MRRDRRHPPARAFVLALALPALAAIAPGTGAQSRSTPAPRVLWARALDATASLKIYNAAGSVHLVGWEHDSILVRGRVGAGARFYASGAANGAKLGVEERADGRDTPPSELVIYLPRRGRVSVKTVSADIAGEGVSGWFYTVSGSIHLSGSTSAVDAESMSGNVHLEVSAPWVHARTGDGHLLLRGAPQDADVSTIGGTLDVASTAVLRGRFASVTGDIHYVGSPPAGAILEFSNHAGAVDFLLPPVAAGVFDLSSVTGDIVNGYSRVQPVMREGRERTLRIDLGPDGGHVTARTFKGAIRLRRQ
jgi:hypothetical protein